MPHRVLLVEDEPEIVSPLVRTLEREGYAVAQAATGREALSATAREEYDVVILDLGLPDMDGLDVCRMLRAADYDGAVLILSGRARELDRVVGLDAGADDYVAKPFGLAELLARLRALLRRTSGRAGQSGVERRLEVDVDAHRVHVGECEVLLTSKEFDVLAVLAANRDKVVSRSQLMSEVWTEGWYGSTKTLDVTIGRLRQKLDRAAPAERVVTVRGVGFRLES
ncbi:MAG TPA: response regulator transcription factor [Nocardioides sp.]|uniref:response regulator transcription factor n=1 Tax=Nocardioides sp. TaxID=35761 RepID=UPI002F42E072